MSIKMQNKKTIAKTILRFTQSADYSEMFNKRFIFSVKISPNNIIKMEGQKPYPTEQSRHQDLATIRMYSNITLRI